MTVTERIADALTPLDRRIRGLVSDACGVPIRILNRAAGGRPVSADHLLRLAAVLGIDPTSAETYCTPWETAGAFDHNALACAIRIYMQMRGHDYRTGAKAAGVSHTVFHRMGTGERASIESVLAGCRYVGLHPFGYLAKRVTRETSAGTAPKQASAA